MAMLVPALARSLGKLLVESNTFVHFLERWKIFSPGPLARPFGQARTKPLPNDGPANGFPCPDSVVRSYYGTQAASRRQCLVGTGKQSRADSVSLRH